MDDQNELWASTELKTAPTMASRLTLFLIISSCGLAADLWTKSHMFGKYGLPHKSPGVDEWVIEDFFGFQTAVNQGALFGMGQGGSSIFALFSVIAFTAILFWLIKGKAWKSRFLTICLGCITGGVTGNFYDRMGWWHPLSHEQLIEWQWEAVKADYEYGVRDFIYFTYQGHVWPNFNIADCLLVCGAFLLLVYSFKYDDEKQTLTEDTDNQPEFEDGDNEPPDQTKTSTNDATV